MAKTSKKTKKTDDAGATPKAKAAKPRAAKAKSASKASTEIGDADGASASGKMLVIVESPAKAKTINKYLGKEYIVKASMGHVRDLPSKGIGIDIEHDFEPTYEPLDGRKKVLAELKKYSSKAGTIYLATDLDREGEAIAWHLAEGLKLPAGKIKRVVFNEITKPAIQEAFSKPRDIDMDMVNAQQARRILDRIVGYQVSPLLWRKIAPGLSAGRVQSVAVRLIVEREREIDAFLPQEYWKIAAVFTPDCSQADSLSKQWKDFLATLDENGNTPTKERQQEFLESHKSFTAELASWKGEKFSADNAQQAQAIAEALGLKIDKIDRKEDPAGKGPAKNLVQIIGSVAPGKKYFISGLSHRQSRTNPPKPFATAALQQAASIQLRFSAQRTMRIAQQLYEGVDVPGEGSVGLITYMRTDSLNLSADAVNQARELISSQFGQQYLPEKPPRYTASQRAQEAHEAIRPTDPNRTPQKLINALTDEQYKLYDLIWKRFLACQMTPAVWNVTEVDVAVDTPAGQAVFRAMGRSLAFDGFMKVTGLPKGGEPVLPPIEEKQPVAPLGIWPTQHFTQPPPRYTEASLVKTLEAEGIGRPSTYASIIQTIQDRNYVELLDRSFRPTNLGLVVIDKLVKHFQDIFDVQFTAKMEDELDKVEEAKSQWVAILKEFYGPFSRDLEKAAEEMVHAKAETQPSDYTCGQCGKPMVYRMSSKGDRYLACTGYPDCKTTHPVDKEGKKVERVEVDTPCPACGGKMLLRRSRFGVFLGCSKYPECKGTLPCATDGTPLKLVKAEDVKENCPECGAPMAVKFKGRRAFLGCTRYPDCKTAGPLPEGIRIEQPPKPPPEQAGINCEKCGKAMLIRVGKRGPFVACSGFPKCRNTMNMDKLEELKKAAEKK